MAITIYAGTVSKRRNSTYVPSSELTADYTCALKDACTEDTPVFRLNETDFPYNYVQWGDHYYFVESVTYLRNNYIEVLCTLDPLATYKSHILNSTCFVSYSSVSGGAWLPDTRIPVLRSTNAVKTSVALPAFSAGSRGDYILAVVGQEGCDLFVTGEATIAVMIQNITQTDVPGKITDIMADWTFSTTEEALEALTNIMAQSDIVGNAFSNAPSCIRSCIWIPFDVAPAISGSAKKIYLGNFDTGVFARTVRATPCTGSVTISIPWQFADWRRGYCEDIYLYLPLVGMINIETDSITQYSSLTINYSYTVTDGCIAYQVVSGNEIIGSYGGSCCANYPIGINQQASAGEVVNTMIAGAENAVASAVKAGLNVAGMAIEAVAGGIKATYDVANVAASSHPTCIGGIGGGAGYGLDRNVTCISVKHDTVVNPSDMQSTMGVPTMKPLQLANCTGYCECANAHIAAPAHADVLNQIDMYVNSGFFIE